ncbi:MAG: hypothetical protein IPO21_14560 [Bacteroidales bacterium]|nr:hypothetical protein [Bacteroidales bacterium]
MNKLEKLTAYLHNYVECNIDGVYIRTLHSIDTIGTGIFYKHIEPEVKIENIKPYLKPITDIDFTPYILQNENDKEKISDAVTDFINRYESCPENLLVEHFKSCPYCLMRWCLSEHYDVFGMIADGDAIEKM